MVEKDKISEEKISFEGIGDFKAVYKHAYQWLIDARWKVTEEKYSEKVKGEGKEIEFEWSCAKELTDYFKAKLTIKWKIENLKDVEVEIDGRRKKMQEFKLEAKLRGVLEKDYKSKWETTSTHKFMKDVYHKYVIPARVEEKEDEVRGAMIGFRDELKAFFDLTAR